MTAFTKLGVIAGGGDLPLRIAEHCVAQGTPVFLARISGFAEDALQKFDGVDHALGEMRARVDALKAAGCDAVVFAGLVSRPDFAAVKFDELAMSLLPRIIAGARAGDDGLLRTLVELHEEQGLRIIAPDAVLGALRAPAGPLGAHAPNARDWADIRKGSDIIAAMGQWDIGQGCVVCEGLVLAVEAQEGTDAMLRRVADLSETIRGTGAARRGVLIKRPKPQQERRIDLPTIGLATIERAAAAGMSGVAVEAHGAIVLQREAVVEAADRLGLFVVGFDP